MKQQGKKTTDEFRAAVTMTVVWVAGLTLIIIFFGLFAGIMLDKLFSAKPFFTIGLTLASIPLTLFATYRVVKAASSRIQPTGYKKKSEEEPHRGENN
jgi:F0F1-type ATP synthase assembly protein I